MEWRSQSWMFNDPCEVCGVKRLDHDPSQVRHRYRSPALPPASTYDCEFWDIVNNTTGGTVERAVHRHGEREGNRAYEAPLPDPESRRLIRERAGLTQQDVADELYVSRWAVARWEKPAGYRNGLRLAAQARTNTIDNFRLVFDRKFMNTIVKRMDSNEEIFKKILDDDEFKARLFDFYASRLFEQFRQIE